MDDLLKMAKAARGSRGGGGVPGMPDLSTLLGDKELQGMDPEELHKQAGQLWKILDDMAENDEEGYAKFIKQQAEGAANAQAAERAKADPDYAAMLKVVHGSAPAMVLELRVISAPTPMSMAIVEVWSAKPGKAADATVGDGAPVSADTRSWEGIKVPLLEARAPRTQRPPLPPGTPPPSAAGGVSVGVYTVVASPLTISAALSGRPLALRGVLAEAAAQFIESRHKLRLQRSPWRVLLNPDLVPEGERRARECAAAAAAGAVAASGTAAEGLSPGLLSQLSSMGVGSKPGTQPGSGARGTGGDDRGARTAAESRGPLITELGSGAGGTDARAAAPGQPGGSAAPPVHSTDTDAVVGGVTELTVSMAEVGGPSGREVVVSARLAPGVATSDVNVEVEGTSVVVMAGGRSRAASLPCAVDDGSASAKFDRKKRLLTVRFPVKEW